MRNMRWLRLTIAGLGVGGCDTMSPSDPGALVPRTVAEDPMLPAIEMNGARFHAETLRAQAETTAQPLPPDVPTLLIVPGADPLIDAGATLAWAREHGRGVDVRVREGGRHELHNDLDRDEVLAAVADWLDARGASNP